MSLNSVFCLRGNSPSKYRIPPPQWSTNCQKLIHSKTTSFYFPTVNLVSYTKTSYIHRHQMHNNWLKTEWYKNLSILCYPQLTTILNDVVKWSNSNLININWNYKTKEIERLYSFKLLDVVTEHNLKWNAHVDSISTKASTRLHNLKVLKRSSLSMICFIFTHQ